MVFHSGDKEFFEEWRAGKVKATELTAPCPTAKEVEFASELLIRDNIKWFVGINGSKYVMFRSFIEPIRAEGWVI